MRALVLGGVLLAASLSVAGETRAGDGGGAASGARRDQIVARVGPRSITVGQVEDRLAALPRFQRAAFGSRPSEVAPRFLDEVLVRDELLALGAAAESLADRPPAAYRIERARSSATIRALRDEIGPASAIPMADVERYYEQNRARYDAPERYQLWRILCKTREEAQAVLDAARRDPSAANFSALARDHSLDKGSNLRGGNLGFLTADGASSEPGLRVDPAIVRAAQTVADGQLVAAPVAEGDYQAVVWRRATLAAVHRTAVEVAPQIRDLLWKARVKQATADLLVKLRADHVRDRRASLLQSIDLPEED